MVSNLGIIFLGGMCYKEIWPKAEKIRKALEELERWQWWEVREATSEVAPMSFLGRRPAGAGQVEAVGQGPAQVDLTTHRFAVLQLAALPQLTLPSVIRQQPVLVWRHPARPVLQTLQL